jgi:spore germination cell wall hydrolase CwlJ-like protein
MGRRIRDARAAIAALAVAALIGCPAPAARAGGLSAVPSAEAATAIRRVALTRAQIVDLVVRRLGLRDPARAPEVLRQANCLAYAIYFEARGESRLGQIAVAQVVLNRLRHPRYPKTICAVITDAGQFPWVTGDLTIRSNAQYRLARSIALHVMAGIFADPTGGSTHFYAPALVGAPAWATEAAFTVTIGGHMFFRYR